MSEPDQPLPDQRDTDAFFAALAGRAEAAGGTADGAAALRAAVLAESHAVHTAGHAEPEQLLTARDAATLAQLTASGVFAAPAVRQPASAVLEPESAVRQRAPAVHRPASPGGPRRLLAWLQRWLGQYWRTWLTAGLALICVTVVLPPPHQRGPDVDVVRGTATPVVAVAQPEAFARTLQQGLESRGVPVRRVAIGDGTWSLAVGAAPPGQDAAVRQFLRSHGYTDLGPPPLVLSVIQK